ncbi:MAG TPA: ABC transporter permease [Streptosporangiaceae bacterium]|nr:ABC transporter permease [Streptosporangiaceae bacterium]
MTDALHAEWTKLRTVTSSAWILLTLAALTVAAGSLAADVVKCPASCSVDPTKISLTGVILGQAAAAGLAVMVMAGEYSTGLVRTTLAATPRRGVVLAAKAAVLTACIGAAGLAGVLGSVLAGHLLLPGNGYTAARGFAAVSLLHGPTLRAAAGSVLYLILIGLLSLGLGAALRSATATAAATLGLLYVLTFIGDIGLNATWQHRIERWTPMDAGLAVQATTHLARQPIAPWPGLGVCALWAAAALAGGWLVLRLRDA